MRSAGRTSASARAKVLPSSRWRRRRVVHHKNSDFDGFSLRRLDDIHSDICSMQSSTLCFSSEVCDGSQKNTVAYCQHSVSIILSKSAVYSTKRRGPSTDPCGTPQVTSLGDVSSPDRWTDCVRPFMYDSSQLSALSLIPKESDSLCIRMSWSTVSNAADIFSSDRSASWPESMALTTSEKTLRSAVSVEWPRLYAD